MRQRRTTLALLGVVRALGGSKRHLVISAIEHPAVIAPAKYLAEQGWNLTVVPVDEYGRVSSGDVAKALRPDTAIVSVMHANNEVGTVQPIRENHRSHKRAGNPAATKGVGALYVRPVTPIKPVLFGADQERDLRPGTENVPAIVGLGMAARLARERLPATGSHLQEMRDLLHQRLREGVPGLMLNGHPQQRLPNTLHVSFPGVSGRNLLRGAGTTVAASVGSACHSEQDEVSGVLAAMGVDSARATGAVRLSVGLMTTPNDIESAAQALVEAWARLHA